MLHGSAPARPARQPPAHPAAHQDCCPASPRAWLLERSNLPISRKRPCWARHRTLACSFSSAREFRTRSTPSSGERGSRGEDCGLANLAQAGEEPRGRDTAGRGWRRGRYSPFPAVCRSTCCSKDVSRELAKQVSSSWGNLAWRYARFSADPGRGRCCWGAWPSGAGGAGPGPGEGWRLTHGGEDAAAPAEGDGDGGLAHAARARVDEHRLPGLHAPSHHQRVVGRRVDDGHRRCLLQGPVGTARGSAWARPRPCPWGGGAQVTPLTDSPGGGHLPGGVLKQQNRGGQAFRGHHSHHAPAAGISAGELHAQHAVSSEPLSWGQTAG